ncbi:MAG: hypothetical protein QOD77_1347 [Thermoplasmata archaeon]|jgi:hypothetical protein|nr:hypothetical protein [Thermoplasmata archaeon]
MNRQRTYLLLALLAVALSAQVVLTATVHVVVGLIPTVMFLVLLLLLNLTQEQRDGQYVLRPGEEDT